MIWFAQQRRQDTVNPYYFGSFFYAIIKMNELFHLAIAPSPNQLHTQIQHAQKEFPHRFIFLYEVHSVNQEAERVLDSVVEELNEGGHVTLTALLKKVPYSS